MFVPPEHRPHGPLPWRPPEHKRRLTRREEAVMLWAVGLFLLTLLLAPLGGSSLVEAIWFLLKG
ncbi:MAG: hypothetical protein EKK53_04975 [Burkholderiales bacterium]|nr:MAG: hypothetical protein EKK53_04975 [Burkholderiales bacterium]